MGPTSRWLELAANSKLNPEGDLNDKEERRARARVIKVLASRASHTTLQLDSKHWWVLGRIGKQYW